jgi:hypothetical protein
VNWFSLVFALTWPATWTLMVRSWRKRWSWYAYGCGAGGVIIGGLTGAPFWQVPIGIGQLAVAVVMHWLNRRRRDKARACLGAKSRALRDALVRRQRELTCPRSVLRPVPGGAR